MTDKAFQRTPVYALEKPASGDIDQGFTQVDFSIRELLWRKLASQQAGGFVRGGLAPQPTGPATLAVLLKAGLAFGYSATDTPSAINGQAGLDDPHPFKPIALTADLTVAVPTAPTSNSRIDLIEVSYCRNLNNSQSRQFLNATTDSFSPSNVPKTLDPTVDATLQYIAAAGSLPAGAAGLVYRSGVVSGSPVAPTVDTGFMAIAYITVGTSVTTISAANISDQRALLLLGMFLGRQIFTASGTYTPTPNTRQVRVRMVAGGGAGGGAPATGASQASVGGGGSSGMYGELNLTGAVAPQGGGTIAITGGAVTIGTGGTGVSGTIGNNGSDTIIVINGTTYDVAGGDGSGVVGPGTPPSAVTGAIPVVSVPGSDFVFPEAGLPGFALSSACVVSGTGGANPFGIGGQGRVITSGNAAGANASQGYGGGGGGGGACASAAATAGGTGGNGLVIIDEYA